MAKRKVILVIVEGSSDDTALHILFDKYFDKNTVYVDIIHGDITTQTKERENIINKVVAEVRAYMANNSFIKTDFQEIIHIMDTDGAFIPDANVIEDATAENPLYSPTEIRTVRKRDIEKRNKVKSFNMNRLSSCKEMWGIKYSAYYMSCNLDHVLYNKLNLTDDEKSDNAFQFAKKYRNDIQSFVKFITQSDFAVVDGHNSSWKYIMKDLHSLERHSNLGLCFMPEQEEKSEETQYN